MGMDQGAGVVSNKYEMAKVNKRAFATVIPAPRISVKRMIFESVVQFFVRLFPCDPSDYGFVTILNVVIKNCKCSENMKRKSF
ncbi:hypothetical protein VNO78_40081 [Psophocarpus tetragonolobus]|uniref:Uncharacterized protein n=1 Tax=Psophocarpus tetragonolobus TaxID=3891 RepID=A0AAN9RAG5_PSOTE